MTNTIQELELIRRTAWVNAICSAICWVKEKIKGK